MRFKAAAVALMLGLTACSAEQAAEPIPAVSLQETFEAEPVPIEMRFDERIEPEYTRDFRLSPQPFPSDPDGKHAGGHISIAPEGHVYVAQFWQDPVASVSVDWPQDLELPFGGAFTVGISETVCDGVTIEERSADVSDSESSRELVRSDANPDPGDPVCAFAWPGVLAHRILPLDQQPDTLEQWFDEIAASPFTYSHRITIHGDRVNVYAWKTESNGITEIREIGITDSGRLYYMNWWRSEPYPGELVNRRTMLRLLPDDKR